jgi:predicted Fe-S protein YdhL (DUF1289 family)
VCAVLVSIVPLSWSLATPASQPRVKPTPCNRICRYNSNFFDGEVCIGCFRDSHEISNWVSMTSQEKSYALEDAAERSVLASFDGSISEEELRCQANGWLGREDSSTAEQNDKRPTPVVSMKIEENVLPKSSTGIPPTPCTRICRYNAEFFGGSVCIGCFRDSFEIGTWGSMGPIEKMYALEDAAGRCEETSNIEQFEGGISRQELLRQAKVWEKHTNGSWEEFDIKTSQSMPENNGYETFLEGDSVILLEKVVSHAESSAIKEAAKAIASRERRKRQEAGMADEGLVRIPALASAARASNSNTPCAESFDSDIDGVLNGILARVCELLDSEHRPMIDNLFGEDSSLHTLFHSDELAFSSREPAVNVYTKGGSFRPHQDGQKLTVLIPLSSINEFEGGGTAFWSSDSRGHRVEGASIELRPDCGTVILFVGHVTHAGVAVEDGDRIVFVASFSPKATSL